MSGFAACWRIGFCGCTTDCKKNDPSRFPHTRQETPMTVIDPEQARIEHNSDCLKAAIDAAAEVLDGDLGLAERTIDAGLPHLAKNLAAGPPAEWVYAICTECGYMSHSPAADRIEDDRPLCPNDDGRLIELLGMTHNARVATEISQLVKDRNHWLTAAKVNDARRETRGATGRQAGWNLAIEEVVAFLRERVPTCVTDEAAAYFNGKLADVIERDLAVPASEGQRTT